MRTSYIHRGPPWCFRPQNQLGFGKEIRLWDIIRFVARRPSVAIVLYYQPWTSLPAMISPFHRPWNGFFLFLPALRSHKKRLYISLGSFLLFSLFWLGRHIPTSTQGFRAGLHAGSNSFGLPYTAAILYLVRLEDASNLLDSLASVKRNLPGPPWPVILFHTGDFDERARGSNLSIMSTIIWSKQWIEGIFRENRVCQARLAVAQEHIIRRKRRGSSVRTSMAWYVSQFAALPP